MFEVTLLHVNRPSVKQIVSDIPEAMGLQDVMGPLLGTWSEYDESTLSEIVKVEYRYMDGYVIVRKIEAGGSTPTPVQQYVVTILDLDDIEVAGTYGPYAHEDSAYSLAEVLLSGHQEDDPDTNYDSRVTPVYNEGGRG